MSNYLQRLAEQHMDEEGDRADRWDEIYHELLESCLTGEDIYNFDPRTEDFCGDELYPHQRQILNCLASGNDKELIDLLNRLFDRYIEQRAEYIYNHYS